MSTRTPFDKLFTERLLIWIHALFHFGKFSLRRVSRLQVAKIKACTKQLVNFEITNVLDVFGNLVLLPTVQHLDLVQPPTSKTKYWSPIRFPATNHSSKTTITTTSLLCGFPTFYFVPARRLAVA
ncbi:hypothetical protein PCASD_07136 [Puccinia coronata f. sp. avenae]|nr:hypothetical protein PCASD_07136 [Puccinia coronata f. sp. avenae]